MSFLSITNVNKKINGKNILTDINLNISKGEFLVLLGESGCGKTTLLRIISGIEKNYEGSIYIEEENITKLQPFKRNFGMVFQNYALFPNMTVEKNITYGLYNKGYAKKEIEEKLEYILNLVGLCNFKNKYPSQLSGGQQQRVALARTLILSPRVLLLDEPLSALDYNVRVKIREEIKKIQKNLGITTIMVTHDQEEALVMGDKIAIMKDSRIVQVDKPNEIYNKPKNQYIAKFMGDLNVIESNNNKIYSRPEGVKYSFQKKEDYIEAIINNIQFRGAFYRVSLNVEGYLSEINVNVHFKDRDHLLNRKSNLIYIKIDDIIDI